MQNTCRPEIINKEVNGSESNKESSKELVVSQLVCRIEERRKRLKENAHIAAAAQLSPFLDGDDRDHVQL